MMNNLTQILSLPVIERLGWVFVHSLWQIAFVGLLFAVAMFVARKSTSRIRYFISGFAFFLTVLLPVVTSCLLVTRDAGSPNDFSTTITSSVQPVENVAYFPSEESPEFKHDILPRERTNSLAESDLLPTALPGIPLPPNQASKTEESDVVEEATVSRSIPVWLALFWCCGILLMSILQGIGWLGILRIRKRGLTPVSAELQNRFLKMVEKAGIEYHVRLMQSSLVRVPMVIGWLRPMVIVPVGILTGLTPDQLEAILLHEIAHVRRHDFLINVLQTIAETLFFYHPMVWWISRRMRTERELWADEFVLDRFENRFAYARALTYLQEYRQQRLLPAVAATGLQLQHRIRKILNVANSREQFGRGRELAFSFVSVLLFTAILAIPSVRSNALEIQEAPFTKAQTPKKQKKENPKPKLDHYGDPIPKGAIARLGTVRFRHTDGTMRDIAFSPTGKTIASSNGIEVKIWDKATGRLVDEIPGGASAIAYSPDGSHLLIGGSSTMHSHLRLWDLKKRKFVWDVRPHIGPSPGGHVMPLEIQRVAFLPDGKTIVSQGRDQTIRIFDAKTGLQKRVLGKFEREQNVLKFAMSRNGSKVAVASPWLIRIWDLKKGGPPVEIEKPHRGFLQVMTFAGDGEMLISAGFSQKIKRNAAGKTTSVTNTPSIHLWNSNTGKRVGDFPVNADRGTSEDLAVTADGKTLISFHHIGFDFWDIKTRRKTRTIEAKWKASYRGRMVISNDDQMLAATTGNGWFRLWKLKTGKEWLGVSDAPIGDVRALAYSPSGRYIATAGYSSGIVHVWDVKTAKAIHIFHLDDDKLTKNSYANAVVFSPDEKTLLISGNIRLKRTSSEFTPSVVQAWRLDDGKLLWTAKLKHTCGQLAVSRDSRLVAVGFNNYSFKRNSLPTMTSIEVLELKSGNRHLSLTGHEKAIRALQFSADGTRLFSASEDKTIRIWSTETGKQIDNVVAKNDIQSATISTDGQIMAFGKKNDLTFWNLENQEELFECVVDGSPLGTGANFMHFSDDKRYLVAGCWSRNKYIRMVELLTGKVSRFSAVPSSAPRVAFSPDGSKLVTGFSDSSSLIWKLADSPVPGRNQSLDSQTFENLWNVLAEPGVVESYRAIFRLANSGDSTVRVLVKQMQPVKSVDPAEVKKLLRDLDNENFKTRKDAFKSLKKMDRLVMNEVEAILKTTNSEEIKQRCDERLKAARSNLVANPEQVRQIRAMQVLEKIGSPKAKALLEKIATGASEARQTTEAKRILKRWEN